MSTRVSTDLCSMRSRFRRACLPEVASRGCWPRERLHGGSPTGLQAASDAPVTRLTREEKRELVRQGRCSNIPLESAESTRLLRALCCRRPVDGLLATERGLVQLASAN